MQEIEVQNIGPVANLKIPVPENGGVVVLAAANGRGKSLVLGAIDKAISGKKDVRVPIKDGEREARLDGLGVSLRVSRKSQVRGEAVVYSLESRLSVADLVDPGIDDNEAADAHRIKALVNLLLIKPDVELFYPLVGGPESFDKYIDPEAKKTDDLLVMASRIKRSLEKHSRREAGEAENSRQRYEACKQAIEGIDLTGEHDSAKLQQDMMAAVATKQRLESEQKAAQQAKDQIELATRRLADAEAKRTGPSVEDAEKDSAAAEFARDVRVQELDDIRKQLAVLQNEEKNAEIRLTSAKNTVESAHLILQSAKDHVNMTNEWRSVINSAPPISTVTTEDIARANSAVTTATRAIKMGGVIEDALRQKKLADGHYKDHTTHAAKSEEFRDAAKGVDRILSDVVAKSGVPLSIEQVNDKMRLVTPTVRGEKTCFGELSPGERTLMSIQIAASAFKREGDRLGELTLAQELWESLDESNRCKVAKLAEELGILIYTAEATEGDIHCEVFNPNHEGQS